MPASSGCPIRRCEYAEVSITIRCTRSPPQRVLDHALRGYGIVVCTRSSDVHVACRASRSRRASIPTAWRRLSSTVVFTLRPRSRLRRCRFPATSSGIPRMVICLFPCVVARSRPRPQFPSSATCDIIFVMRRAGVREARQNLTALLDDVKKGREVVITERGRAVARLAPVQLPQRFPDLSRIRRLFKRRDVALSQAVTDGRNDRL